MRTLLSHPRAGLTLLEVLVVLVILALTTALVPLAWRQPRATAGSALHALTQSARHSAIRRGEELRLRVDDDGVWVLAARHGADILDTGRIAAPPTSVSLRIDPLGSCRPGSDAADSRASFDMLGCRVVSTPPLADGVPE